MDWEGRKSKTGRRRRTRRVLIILEVIIMVLVGAGSYAWAKLGKLSIVSLDEEKVEVNKDLDTTKYTGYTNVALFGLDSRDKSLGKGNRSDTMIIASVNNDTGEIRLMSVYRDTFLKVGDIEFNKCNAAYSYGGPEQALSMLNRNLDLNIDEYVASGFQALATAIDCMGGLDIEMTAEEVVWTNGYIAETTEASDIFSYTIPEEEISDGVKHLNGIQATSYCRIRYTKGDDFRRTERQRVVLSKMFEKAKTMSLEELNKIADRVFPMIQTSLTLPEIIRLGTRILDFNIVESAGFSQQVTTGYVEGCGSTVLPVDLEYEVKELHRILFGEVDYQVSQTVREIAARINGTAVSDTPFEGDDNDDYYYNIQQEAEQAVDPNVQEQTVPVEDPSLTPTEPVDEPLPQDTGGETPPSDTGGETPPPDTGGETPPPDTGGETPPPDTGGGDGEIIY